MWLVICQFCCLHNFTENCKTILKLSFPNRQLYAQHRFDSFFAVMYLSRRDKA